MNELALYCGDCREILKELPEKSVHCCVTSPPYWGLRDYGLDPLVWGGDGDCEHEWGSHYQPTKSPNKPDNMPNVSSNLMLQGTALRTGKSIETQFCQLCNAWCGSLGLEPTPELYVQHLVEIFREVKRVLRDDGTVWLNMGSSYAGSGMQSSNPGGLTEKQITNQGSYSVGFGDISPNQSHPDVSPCDNGDKEQSNLKENDHVYPDSDDEFPDGFQNRRGCKPHNAQSHQQSFSHPGRKVHDNGQMDFGQVAPGVSLSDEPVSKHPSSSDESLLNGSNHNREESSPSVVDSFSGNSFLSSHKESNKIDNSLKSPPLADHNQDKESSFLASQPPGLITNNLPNIFQNVKFKPKDLIPIPWMVAMALQADGWYLRSDIIWAKPNPMPESVTDRPTKAHEYLFLLSKKKKYYYDADAVREVHSESTLKMAQYPDSWRKEQKRANESHSNYMKEAISNPTGRNKRSVWTIPTQPFPEAHFAVYPEDLIEPCILAGCPRGGTVLDPFIGAGTTAKVSTKNNRKCIGIDLSSKYIEMSKKRVTKVQRKLFGK